MVSLKILFETLSDLFFSPKFIISDIPSRDLKHSFYLFVLGHFFFGTLAILLSSLYFLFSVGFGLAFFTAIIGTIFLLFSLFGTFTSLFITVLWIHYGLKLTRIPTDFFLTLKIVLYSGILLFPYIGFLSILGGIFGETIQFTPALLVLTIILFWGGSLHMLLFLFKAVNLLQAKSFFKTMVVVIFIPLAFLLLLILLLFLSQVFI